MASRFGQWKALAYVAPAFAGISLVFFMVKPVLASPGKPPESIPVLPDEQAGPGAGPVLVLAE